MHPVDGQVSDSGRDAREAISENIFKVCRDAQNLPTSDKTSRLIERAFLPRSFRFDGVENRAQDVKPEA